MKKILGILTTLAILVVVFNACQPAEYKEVGTPQNYVSSLSGTWKLTRATQTDEDSKRKGFPYQQLDLTTLFPYTEFRVTFNTNGATPTTFTTVPGRSPKVIRLASGNWTVDDPLYPKMLTLVNGNDTAKVMLGGYPSGFTPALKITQERKDATGRLVMSYSYEFLKQ